MNTKYQYLPEDERDSDRKEADKILKVIEGAQDYSVDFSALRYGSRECPVCHHTYLHFDNGGQCGYCFNVYKADGSFLKLELPQQYKFIRTRRGTTNEED